MLARFVIKFSRRRSSRYRLCTHRIGCVHFLSLSPRFFLTIIGSQRRKIIKLSQETLNGYVSPLHLQYILFSLKSLICPPLSFIIFSGIFSATEDYLKHLATTLGSPNPSSFNKVLITLLINKFDFVCK